MTNKQREAFVAYALARKKANESRDKNNHHIGQRTVQINSKSRQNH